MKHHQTWVGLFLAVMIFLGFITILFFVLGRKSHRNLPLVIFQTSLLVTAQRKTNCPMNMVTFQAVQLISM